MIPLVRTAEGMSFSPQKLMQLVLDYTNTNDYDDCADGWLSTALHDGGELFEVTFTHHNGEISAACWSLVPPA
jgi:hypothetical protein